MTPQQACITSSLRDRSDILEQWVGKTASVASPVRLDAIMLRGHMWGPGICVGRSHAVAQKADLTILNRAGGSYRYAVGSKTGLRLRRLEGPRLFCVFRCRFAHSSCFSGPFARRVADDAIGTTPVHYIDYLPLVHRQKSPQKTRELPRNGPARDRKRRRRRRHRSIHVPAIRPPATLVAGQHGWLLHVTGSQTRSNAILLASAPPRSHACGGRTFRIPRRSNGGAAVARAICPPATGGR